MSFPVTLWKLCLAARLMFKGWKSPKAQISAAAKRSPTFWTRRLLSKLIVHNFRASGHKVFGDVRNKGGAGAPVQ